MTCEQIAMMEKALQVTLPAAYKEIVLAFPWRDFVGGTEFSLWDDAALNVERTLEYRKGYGGVPPWPRDYVHIGDDEDACPYVLSCIDGIVVKTDHGNLKAKPVSKFRNMQDLVRHLQEELGDEAG